MRTHKQIMSDNTISAIRRALADRGVELSDPTVRSWARRGAIPAAYWMPLVDAKVATLDELAKSVRPRAA